MCDCMLLLICGIVIIKEVCLKGRAFLNIGVEIGKEMRYNKDTNVLRGLVFDEGYEDLGFGFDSCGWFGGVRFWRDCWDRVFAD